MRVAAVMPLCLSLGAAGPGFVPFTVTMTGLEVLAVPAERRGTERPLDHGGVVLRAGVGMEHGAQVTSRASFNVAGLNYSLSRGQALLAARSASGGTLRDFPKAKVFCDRQRERNRDSNGKLLVLRGVARFERLTRLCLVDADDDRSFEKAFVVGARVGSDWQMTDIPPIPYAERRHIGLGNSWQLQVIYLSNFAGGGNFSVSLRLDGQNVDLSAVKLRDRNRKVQATRVSTKFKGGKLPFRYQVGSAAFVVTAVDGKQITIRQDSDLDYAPLTYSLVNRTKIWYIYY